VKTVCRTAALRQPLPFTALQISMKLPPKTPKPTEDRSFGNRWAPELKEDGFAQISSFFLENYHRLKEYPMTHGEAMFVVHLMQYKWTEKSPYPAYKTLALKMAVDPKTTRRLAKSLEEKGYLKRVLREAQTNKFDLSGLFKALVSL
jgi:hypothetical protein